MKHLQPAFDLIKKCPNLTLIASGIILLYSCLFFPICPSPQLAFAIAIELGAFILLALPISGNRSLSNWTAGTKLNTLANITSWPERKLKELENRYAVFRLLQSNWRKVTTLIAFSMISLALVDLSALWLAVSGATPASITLYSALPVSYLLGGHPAFSMEMLTGACVESHQYDRAESLYKAVLKIRQNVYGNNHPMVAALYADLGDLYQKMHRLDDAQKWYRASVKLTEGQGRALHRLANLLRDSGENEQSADLYKRALTLQEQYYGKTSTKYQATLTDYQALVAQSRTPSSTKELTH